MNKCLKKSLAIGLVGASLIPSAVLAKEFKDVTKNGDYSWAYAYIDELSDKGIINGYPDNTYKPNDPVSFEETLKLILGIQNPSSSEKASYVKKYESDMKKYGVSTWAYEAVANAIEKGIITVNTLKEAESKSLINAKKLVYPDRNTVSVYFAKALGLSQNNDDSILKHKDKSSIPAVTKAYLVSLVKAGIFSDSGSDGKFEGNRFIRRSEMAKITKLSYDYSKSGARLNTSELKTITGKVLLSTNLNNLESVIIDQNGKRYQFRVDNSTVYKDGDKAAKFSDIAMDQEVKISYYETDDKTVAGLAKEIVITNSSKELVGYITNISSQDVTIKYRKSDKNIDTLRGNFSTTDTGRFEFDNNSKIYKFGDLISTSNLSVDDMIEFKTNSNGKVIEANVYPKNSTVVGTIESIESATRTNRESIKVRFSNNKTFVFYGNDYNTNNSKFSGLRNNDRVTLTLNYREVTGVNEQNNENYVTGRVKYVSRNSLNNYGYGDSWYIELETNSNSTLRLYTDNRTNLKLNGVLNFSQYDLKSLEGRYVKIERDRDYIKSIEEINSSQNFRAVGQVVRINTDNTLGFRAIYTFKIISSNNSSIKLGSEQEIDLGNSNRRFNMYDTVYITGNVKENSYDNVSAENITLEFKSSEYRELTPDSSYGNNNSNSVWRIN